MMCFCPLLLLLKVTVAGEPDKKTGMVMNISDLKKIIKTNILDVLDHKNIDKQVEYFREGRVSTTENVAIFCWDSIHRSIPSPATVSYTHLTLPTIPLV